MPKFSVRRNSEMFGLSFLIWKNKMHWRQWNKSQSVKSWKSSHLEEVCCNSPELSCKMLVLDDELVESQLLMLVSRRNLHLGIKFFLWLVLRLGILFAFVFVIIDLIFLFYFRPIVWGFFLHYLQAFSHMVEYSRSRTLISAGAEV
jgi:hypothetical protein